MPRQYTMTSQGKRALEAELERLRERRQEVAELLASARSQGDITENAEYQEGKYQQGLVEGRIAEVETILANAVIVELKAVKRLLEEHEAQLLNYLKSTPYEVGLLLNFGPKPEIKRKAFDNSRKGSMDWIKESTV